MELGVKVEGVIVGGDSVNDDHSEDWSAFGGIGEATTNGRFREGTLLRLIPRNKPLDVGETRRR